MLALCIQVMSPFPYRVRFQVITLSCLQMCYLWLFVNITWVENCSCLIPWARLCGKGINWWTWWGRTDRDGGLGEWPSISTRWWVYASSLPRGPDAMTCHPSPYALIHFTFISTSNDFAPVKGRERRLRHLLGRSGIFFLQWQLVVLLESAARGYIAITEVTQDSNNNHFRLLMYTRCFMQLALKQIDTCLNVHMHAHRLIAHSHTHSHSGWWAGGSVHCNMLGSLYRD